MIKYFFSLIKLLTKHVTIKFYLKERSPMKCYSMLTKTFQLTAAVFTSLFMVPGHEAYSDCLGKVELAPAYIHIDVIESRNTIKELDMAGVRADISYVFEDGWMIKPSALYGKEKDGEIVNFAFGFGRCIPINKKWIITPTGGVTYTNMGTSIHLDLGAMGEVDFRERFKAIAPYVGMEVIYNIAPCWRICANAQYSWSRSKTEIKNLLTEKSNAEGPAYALLVEYDITKCWSVNIGGAYNESYSKEKNGIRARGGKIGIVRWF